MRQITFLFLKYNFLSKKDRKFGTWFVSLGKYMPEGPEISPHGVEQNL
jgi:hypothetical protein